MTDTTPQPFTWEAYVEALAENPEFDLFELFTFDHLSEQEIVQVMDGMRSASDRLQREALALRRVTR